MAQPSFDVWMKTVNNLCDIKFGLSVDDLPDYNWRSDYDDGISPSMALKNCVETM